MLASKKSAKFFGCFILAAFSLVLVFFWSSASDGLGGSMTKSYYRSMTKSYYKLILQNSTQMCDCQTRCKDQFSEEDLRLSKSLRQNGYLTVCAKCDQIWHYFVPLGQNFEHFYQFLRVYLIFGQDLNLHWLNFNALGNFLWLQMAKY